MFGQNRLWFLKKTNSFFYFFVYMVYGVLASWIKELLKDKEGLVPGFEKITSFACLVRPGLKTFSNGKPNFVFPLSHCLL